MTTELATIPQRAQIAHREAVLPTTMQELERVAHAFAHSGAFPDVRSMAQAFVRIQAGQEFGLGPMASMMGIYFIEGKPTLAAVTIAGCVKKSGVYNYRQVWLTRTGTGAAAKIVPSTDPLNDNIVGCTLRFYESGEYVGDSSFTDEDAAKAGLSHGVNWKKYPKNMYFSRAMTNGCRWYCPDLFGGAIYTPDELNDKIEVDDAGRPTNLLAVVGASFGDDEEKPKPVDPRKPLTMKALIDLFEVRRIYLDPSFAGLKLGGWLEKSGIAPGLSSRIDDLTGRQALPTEAEMLAAEDALRALGPHPPDEGPVVPQERVEEIAAVYTTPVPEPEPFPDVPEPVGITDAQRRRIMAMFGERSEALVRLFPIAKNAEARRHAFAAHVLGDAAKGSSSTWTGSEYTRVSDELEQLPKNGEV